MRPLFVSIWAFAIAVVGVKFTTPPPFEETTDYSKLTVYAEGAPLQIGWTDVTADNNTSLTMWQYNVTAGSFFGPLEYLLQNVSSSITNLDWTVQTTKDLTLSNTFFFSLFIQGETRPEAQSHYFNISSNAATTTSDTGGSSTILIYTTQIVTPSITQSTSISSSTAASSTSTHDGLSTGAKAGLGVGISAAALLGFGAVWYIFGRQKKQKVSGGADPTTQSSLHGQEEWKQRYPLSGEGIAELQDQERSKSTWGPEIYELPEAHRS